MFQMMATPGRQQIPNQQQHLQQPQTTLAYGTTGSTNSLGNGGGGVIGFIAEDAHSEDESYGEDTVKLPDENDLDQLITNNNNDVNQGSGN